MKKIFLLIALFLTISSVCYSQSLWYWQNPKPTGNNVKSVESVGPSTFFAGGDAGMLLKSTNSGINWYPTISGVDHTSSINDIEFLSAQVGILVGGSNNGGSGFIRYTSDGGSTWVNKGSTAYPMYRISRLNSNVLFATGEGQVYRTTNAGMSWTSILSYGNLRSVSFINSNTGIAAGYKTIYQGGFPPVYYTRSLILRTYNGGATWIPDSLGNGFQFNDIGFATSQKGFVIGSSGHIFKTTNSGINWSAVPLSNQNYNRILILDSSNILMTLTNGIIRTTDGGLNWISQSFGGDNNDVAFNSSGNGIYVASKGIMYRTSNNGLQWQNIQNGFYCTYDWEQFNGIHFYDANYGAAVCMRMAEVYFYKTTNGGNNWIAQNNMTYRAIFDVFLINKDTIFCVGENGSTNRTTNGGINWVSNVNCCGDLFGVNFLNQSTGFVVGYGRIGKTTNTGQSWSFQNTNPQYILKDVFFFDDSIGAVTGQAQGGAILWTTDCGSTWLTRNSGLSTYTSLNGIRLLNKTTAVIADRDGRVLRTTNSGINWSIVFSGSYTFNEVCFRDSLNGIVVGNNGVILKTSNAGISWSVQQSDVTNNLYGCSVKGPNDFAVAGSYLSILSTTDINTIGVQTLSSDIPRHFLLSQNYPNPFNPQTKIKFDVPANVKGQTSNLKLIIYDMLGREVATLVNEELKPGTYEADWDASNFSSGVYFYRIIAGDYTKTKKMVLMK